MREGYSTLRAADLIRTAMIGLRSRKLRAVLSGFAVAVGIAAVVGVLGITRSSESALLARIDQTGTNMLTVTNGQNLAGQEVELPTQSQGMIGRASGVMSVAPTAELSGFSVYRSDQMPASATNGLSLRTADRRLPGSPSRRERSSRHRSRAIPSPSSATRPPCRWASPSRVPGSGSPGRARTAWQAGRA